MAQPKKSVPFHDELNEFMNLNPLIPQSIDNGKNAMEIGSSFSLNMWGPYDGDQFNVGFSQMNQIETKKGYESFVNLNIEDFVMEDEESFSMPLPCIDHCGEEQKNKGCIDISGLLKDPIPEHSESVPNPSLDDWEMSDESDNPNHPTPMQLPVQEPFSFPYLFAASERGNSAIDDPLQRAAIISKEMNSPGSSSKASAETSNHRETNMGTQCQENMNLKQLSVWSNGHEASFCCSSCQTLRTINHIKGDIVTQLHIHGLLGIFFHAILYEQQGSKEVSQEMFDLYGNSIDEVKQFLTQYCLRRKQDGYTMLKDPHSTFFEALCIGLDWFENLPVGDSTEKIMPPDTVEIQMDETVINKKLVGSAGNEAENNTHKGKRPFTLKEQRKRSKELTFADISPYFHLTRKEAAKVLGFSETVVRNALSKYGEDIKWPSRKIQSLEKKISELTPLLKSDDPNQREYAKYEIERKRKKIAQYYKEGAKCNKRR